MRFQLSFTIPGQGPQTVEVEEAPAIIGTLLSNQVVVRAPGVEPIHAMIEESDGGDWRITDLGSGSGVIINDRKIGVEAPIKVGDVLTLGSVSIAVEQYMEKVQVSGDYAVSSGPFPAETAAPRKT